MPIDTSQDPNQDQGQNPSDLLAQLFGPVAGPPAPEASDQSNPLAKLVGLVAQARQQGAPVQQAPLPQVLGPAGTPSQPYQPAQPERPQPQSISDFLSDATKSTPANNASSASVMHEGEKQQPKLPQTAGGFDTQFNTPGSDYYVSPAKRMLQNFMIGLAALGGHTGFETSRQQKYQEWQTDIKTDLANQSKFIQRTKEADLQQSRQARLAFNQQKQQDANTLSAANYRMKYNHYTWEETNADKKLALASKAEQDRQAGRQQSLELQAMGPAMRAATAYVKLQHQNAGDDLNDPAVQDQMKVEIADRIDEEQPRVHADMAWTALGASGALDGVDLNNAGQVQQAINNADIKPEDKHFLKGYYASHGTPGTQTEAGIRRAQTMVNGRELNALNTDTDQLQFANKPQIDASHGTIVPAGPGIDVQARGSLAADVQRATNQAVSVWQNVKKARGGEISPLARTALYRIANISDKGLLGTYLESELLSKLNPQETALVQSMGSLKEQALIMRGIQKTPSTESTRAAIDAIIPVDGSTPNADYALKQLGLLQNQLNMAKSGIPKLGKVTENQEKLSQVPENPSGSPQTQWRRNKKTGEVQSSPDGGKTWQTRKP